MAGKHTRLVTPVAYIPFTNDFHTSAFIECLTCGARLKIGWLRGKDVVAQAAKAFADEHKRHGRRRLGDDVPDEL